MTRKYNRESLQHSAQFFYMEQVQHLNNLNNIISASISVGFLCEVTIHERPDTDSKNDIMELLRL